MTDTADARPAKPDPHGLLAQLFGGDGEDFGALAEAADPPLHWPSLTPGDAAVEWRSVYVWVVQLQHRFREMVRLPACWYRHNGIVEALAALRDHERASYADTAAPTSAVAWHAAFRDVEVRLRMWIAELRCGGDLDFHDPAVHAATVPDTTPTPDFTAWLAADRHARGHATEIAAVTDGECS